MMTKVLIGIIVALIAYSGWNLLHISALKLEKQVLITDNQKLTTERDVAKGNVRTANSIIDLQIQQLDDSDKRLATLHEGLRKSTKQVTRMQDLFNGTRFNELLQKNPTVMTIRMGKATKKVLQRLEESTQ